MRALFNPTLFVRSALKSGNSSNIRTIFEALADGQFTLLVPEALLDEIANTVANQAYLRTRISPQQAYEICSLLKALGEEIPRIIQPLPAVTRDPKDDYLVAYALIGEADYLVTGDKELLALAEHITDTQIISPLDFATLLHAGV